MNKRGCYCDLWDKNPTSLIEQGVPLGYCGICTRCGKPGHLRQAPGATPVTLAWCDSCFRRETVFMWLRFALMAIALGGAIGFVAKKWL